MLRDPAFLKRLREAGSHARRADYPVYTSAISAAEAKRRCESLCGLLGVVHQEAYQPSTQV